LQKRLPLRAEHPNTLTSTANLASTYSNQGRLEEAEGLEVQVLETRKRVLGAEHPDTLSSMSNLAHTWKNQKRDFEALTLMRECIELRTRVLGPDHPKTVSCSAVFTYWREEKLDMTTPSEIRNN
jgi:Tetratricopeptide repeat